MADAFSVSSISFREGRLLVPISDDDLGARKGSRYAAQQKIELRRRDSADGDQRYDIGMLVRRRICSGTDTG